MGTDPLRDLGFSDEDIALIDQALDEAASSFLETVDQPDAFRPWIALGALLGKHREMMGMSMREAAMVAGFSDATWRQLEAGRKASYGQSVVPNPSDNVLFAAAAAVDLPPYDAFALVGRALPPRLAALHPHRLLDEGWPLLPKIKKSVPPRFGEQEPASVDGRIARLSPAKRERLFKFLDELLGED